jgi:hypothetical protein
MAPEFTRRAPVDFGARLANARNMRPDEAPAAPRPRQIASVPITHGGPSLPPAASPHFYSDLYVKPVPKYGGVKGSYVSPFDSGGKTPGEKHLPASSTTVEEFEAKYGSEARRAAVATAEIGEDASEGSAASNQTVVPTQAGRTMSFGMMPPVQIQDTGKGPAGPVAKQKDALVVPEGVGTLQHTLSCTLKDD